MKVWTRETRTEQKTIKLERDYKMVIMIACGIVYLLPTLVAISNKKTNAGAVAVLNIFLGWLLIPWVIALTWAVCKDKK